MLVLGVHGGYLRADEDNRTGYARHDSAAVLLRDGEILAAIEEERLSRIKHSNCFPIAPIRYCLDQERLTLDDIDLVAVNHEEFREDFLARNTFLDRPELDIVPEGRTRLASIFEREFGLPVSSKIRFCNHHLAHAWSAYSHQDTIARWCWSLTAMETYVRAWFLTPPA